MTFAQFRRMKPKYRRRLVFASFLALVLFLALMVGVSFGVSAIRRQINTTELKKVTSVNILQEENLPAILKIVGQDDAANMLVNSSTIVMRGDGKVTELTVSFVNLSSTNTAEEWLLRSNEKKTTLRRVNPKYENMSYLKMRKVPFSQYFPGLTRALAPELAAFLEKKAPVGATGSYTFTDDFGDNLSPEYTSYLVNGLSCAWVSKTGSLTEIVENSNFQRPANCVPTVVSVIAPDKTKSKGSRVVLGEPKEQFVVLFEAAAY